MKVKFKVTLGGVVFIALLLLFGSQVKADTVNLEPLKEYLNNNDVIKLDIKESEYEKAEEAIKNKITKAILGKKGGEKVELVVRLGSDVGPIDNIKEAYIAGVDGFNTKTEKNINIEYSNSSKYNEKEAQELEKDIMQKLNLSNIYSRYIISENINLGEESEALSYIMNNLKEKINDESLKMVAFASPGGAGPLGGYENVFRIFCFKDDVYYTQFLVAYVCVRQVIIPEEIEETEEAYINYALPKVQEYLAGIIGDSEAKNYSLKKIQGYYYKLIDTSQGMENVDDSIYPEDTIILKKENPVVKEPEEVIHEKEIVKKPNEFLMNKPLIGILVCISIILVIIIVVVIRIQLIKKKINK